MSSKVQNKIKNIGVVCSGGDAPGMNACIRAVVRYANFKGFAVFGIHNGYAGLLEEEIALLDSRSVGNIIQRGGTILRTSRCPEFRKANTRKRAFEILSQHGINKLIVLGGDGSMSGAACLSDEFNMQVVGVPCTIDNDLPGTDFSIGFDSAVQTAVESIDRIRDTADSHGRVFIVEVMGKNTGHIALETALAVGAEFVVLPERSFRLPALKQKILQGLKKGKAGSIIIVAEQDKPGFSLQIAEQLQPDLPVDVRTVILGHLQRGGHPTGFDRNLGSIFGACAVEALIKGKSKKMTKIKCGKPGLIDFAKVVGHKKPADISNLKLVDRLSI